MSDRQEPFYCPYCGDEDLRPHGEAHGVWECRACRRVFGLAFRGLLSGADGGVGTAAPARDDDG